MRLTATSGVISGALWYKKRIKNKSRQLYHLPVIRYGADCPSKTLYCAKSCGGIGRYRTPQETRKWRQKWQVWTRKYRNCSGYIPEWNISRKICKTDLHLQKTALYYESGLSGLIHRRQAFTPVSLPLFFYSTGEKQNRRNECHE